MAAALALSEQGYAEQVAAMRQAFRPVFYLPDVPAEVIEADEATAATVMPGGAIQEAAMPGEVARSARNISVPVYLAFGETDIAQDKLGEVSLYANAAGHLSYFEVPGSGHCHNFAASRRELWDHLTDWLRVLRNERIPTVVPI